MAAKQEQGSQNSRDNFTQKTIQILRERVAGLCSNPGCRVPTLGPNQEFDKSTITGVAAHITAAAKNGPRYDARLTTEQRRHINNAIWLCQNCGKLIDTDVKRFSVPLLEQWKVEAEQYAQHQQTSPQNNNGAVNTASKLVILPEQSANLIGRVDILEKLQHAITQPQGSSHLLVNGMGGVGKTAICKKLAHDVVSQVNAVVWLDGQSGLELAIQSRLTRKL